jgi:tRNA threonylcarbamoyladenosine biosynthesis protein TsaB
VAQGLAFGANVPLVPVDTLLAVAEEARHAFGARQVVAVLDARMDQLYAARYDFAAGGPLGALGGDDEPLLLSPEDLEVPAGWGARGQCLRRLRAAPAFFGCPPRGAAERHRLAAAGTRAARGGAHGAGRAGLAAVRSG